MGFLKIQGNNTYYFGIDAIVVGSHTKCYDGGAIASGRRCPQEARRRPAEGPQKERPVNQDLRPSPSVDDAEADLVRLRQELALAQVRNAHAEAHVRDLEVALERERLSVIRPILRRFSRLVRRLAPKLGAALAAAARRRLLPGHPGADRPTLPALDLSRIETGRTGGGLVILLIGAVDWAFRIQRPQHLARALARRGHRVIYLQPNPSPGAVATVDWFDPGDPGVTVAAVGLGGRPLRPSRTLPDPELVRDLRAGVSALLDRLALAAADVVVVEHPFWAALALELPGAVVVYDCLDLHLGFHDTAGWIDAEERRLVARAELVVATSQPLADRFAGQRAVAVIRNAAADQFFAPPPADGRGRADGRRILGYYGAIAQWFDVALVAMLARSFPECRVVLVGDTAGADLAGLAGLPNVELVGELPFSTLPGHLHSFDVCLLPFLDTPLTRCTDATKLYEYCAAGKPVVATALPETRRLGEVIAVAEDRPDFVRLVGAALAAGADAAAASRRREWAAGETWAVRAGAFEQSFRAWFPRVSVIVLCYNRLDLTEACVTSLRNTAWPELEIILVDNASADATPAFLAETAAADPRCRALCHPGNLGFAAGMNSGVRVADGEILVLLNNDTVVPPDWLAPLVQPLLRDPRLGLVGPVTNAIDNEARVETAYRDPTGMLAFARRRAWSHHRLLLPCDRLGFFCVALRRQTWQAVGELDESFDVGYFEDDDYCLRVQAQGLSLAIAEGCFVHHAHGAAFALLDPERKAAIHQANKRRFEAKWGPWRAHHSRAPEP